VAWLVRISLFFDALARHVVAYVVLIVSAICSGYIAFDRGHHDLFEPQRIWFAVTVLLLVFLLYRDVRDKGHGERQ
jgi:hypothetical protein